MLSKTSYVYYFKDILSATINMMYEKEQLEIILPVKCYQNITPCKQHCILIVLDIWLEWWDLAHFLDLCGFLLLGFTCLFMFNLWN